MRTKPERAVTWSNPAAQMCTVLNSSSFCPQYSCLPVELASILPLAFSLFALVAGLLQCLCSESPYLSIKLYRIYVCYMNITLYIAFGIICSRSWNVLPTDTGAQLYIYIQYIPHIHNHSLLFL
jgi:hypothetical protein